MYTQNNSLQVCCRKIIQQTNKQHVKDDKQQKSSIELLHCTCRKSCLIPSYYLCSGAIPWVVCWADFDQSYPEVRKLLQSDMLGHIYISLRGAADNIKPMVYISPVSDTRCNVSMHDRSSRLGAPLQCKPFDPSPLQLFKMATNAWHWYQISKARIKLGLLAWISVDHVLYCGSLL